MSQLHLSDEILMAFADGELDESVAAAVEQAMLRDPTITRRVAGFLRSRRLTRSAFASQRCPDVPPELHAAVLKQIKAFEKADGGRTEPAPQLERRILQGERWFSVKGVLAASLATLAVATGSYFAGRQTSPPLRSTSLVAQLEDAPVRAALSTVASGHDVALPLGQVRVVSTYRTATGSLCREFRVQASSGTTVAVACRDGDWNITFALAGGRGNAAYIPSSGADLVTSYLQEIGAGEPLVDAAETAALGQSSR